ncbi:MAG: hypothetical protein ABIQ81_08725 [Novosphingobium sp.]
MTATSPPPLDSSCTAATEPAFRAMTRKWSAIHQAAAVVAALADLPDDAGGADLPDDAGGAGGGAHGHFPAAIRSAGGWRLALAAQGIDDLAAVMEPGLAALLSIHCRGANPAVAAQALWDEFQAAREALLALRPPH